MIHVRSGGVSPDCGVDDSLSGYQDEEDPNQKDERVWDFGGQHRGEYRSDPHRTPIVSTRLGPKRAGENACRKLTARMPNEERSEDPSEPLVD
jgi:hypothetical protein